MDSIQEQLDVYIDNNKMYSFEGSRGVQRMEKIMREVCGYDNSFNGTMQMFFEDNPGAIEAVVEWIGTQRSTSWKENLEDLVGPAEEDEVGDLAPCEGNAEYWVSIDIDILD